MARTQRKPRTDKHEQVLSLVSEGLSIQEIAKRLDITEGGVYGHIARIKSAGHSVPEIPRRSLSAPPVNRQPTTAPPENAGVNGHAEDAVTRLAELESATLDEERRLVAEAKEQIQVHENAVKSLTAEVAQREQRVEQLEDIAKRLKALPVMA
jgi:predicted ArsR family transcriptional regulator